MGLDVYCDPGTINSHKVLAALETMGVPYNLKAMSFFKGEQKEESYRKISPSQTFPAGVDGDLHIFESNAIMSYAADKYAKDASFYPKDLAQRARVDSWLLWEASAWFPVCYKYLIQYTVNSWMGKEPDMDIIKEAEPTFHKHARMLEDQLSQTKFLVGSTPTIADFAVAASIHAHVNQGLPWDNYPHLQKWMKEGVQSLEGWKKTQEIVDKTFNLNTFGGTNGAVLPLLPKERSSGSSVTTTLNYTKDTDPQLTEIYFYETPKATGIHEPGDDAREVEIHDGWSKVKEFTLDKNGFELSENLHTSFDNWEDEENVHASFYPEVVEFLKRSLGAKSVLVFDHTIRTKANEAKKLTTETATSQRAPVMLVHCDYTAESGPLRVKQLLPDEAESLLQRRVAFINVWKPIHNIVEERPLAMADVTSTPSSDFFKLHLRYRDRNGENYVMKHNDAHKWFYFPKMTPEQVILLKTYDSEEGVAQFVGHSAFVDPTSPPDAKTRESVEIRTICFF
jgi:glutathione S-transferase